MRTGQGCGAGSEAAAPSEQTAAKYAAAEEAKKEQVTEGASAEYYGACDVMQEAKEQAKAEAKKAKREAERAKKAEVAANFLDMAMMGALVRRVSNG